MVDVLLSNCVILVSNHTISYHICIYITYLRYVVFFLCLFLLVQDHWSTYVCIEQQIGSTICSLWMNLFVYKSQVFHVHFGNYVLCLLCFPNHNKITKEQKTCILSKKACIFFGCQKITLVDNLLV